MNNFHLVNFLILLNFVYGFHFILFNPLYKKIGSSIIAASLLTNKIDYLDKIPNHPQVVTNNESESTANIKIVRNNIYLYGEISPESCEELKNKLNELDFNGRLFKISYNQDPPPINLHIQSSGGTLMNSFYIVDLIESLETPVNTYVDGYSASAATLINVVGSKRYITKNSMMMIHQLSSGSLGKYEELQDDSNNMNLLMNKIKNIYLKNTNIPEEVLNQILKHDLWMDAETCKDYGLVDEII